MAHRNLAALILVMVVAFFLPGVVSADTFYADSPRQDEGLYLGAFPIDGMWSGVIVQFVGLPGVVEYRVIYQSEVMPEALLAVLVPGANTDGVTLKAPVNDKTLAGRRARYEVQAVDSLGQVIGASGFEIVHSSYVAFDKWSMEKLARLIGEELEGLFLYQENGPGAIRLENAWNTLQEYGYFGEAKAASVHVSGLVTQSQQGAHGALSDLEADLFSFPIRVPDGRVFMMTMPIASILAIPEWVYFWLVVNATLWGGFMIWLITRLSPKNST